MMTHIQIWYYLILPFKKLNNRKKYSIIGNENYQREWMILLKYLYSKYSQASFIHKSTSYSTYKTICQLSTFLNSTSKT